MEEFAIVHWQNLSGDWFQGNYPLPSAHVIFAWKCGTPNKAAEIIIDGAIERWTK